MLKIDKNVLAMQISSSYDNSDLDETQLDTTVNHDDIPWLDGDSSK